MTSRWHQGLDNRMALVLQDLRLVARYDEERVAKAEALADLWDRKIIQFIAEHSAPAARDAFGIELGTALHLADAS